MNDQLSDLNFVVAYEFVTDAGLAVFCARPNPSYDPARTNSQEFFYPSGWQAMESNIDNLKGWQLDDALCLITGDRLDGVDVDTKNGASVEEQIRRLESFGVPILGIVDTPTGGAHLYVPSTGIASNANQAAGVDYRGAVGKSSRGFLFLPGTKRLRYKGQRDTYKWRQYIDLEQLNEITPAQLEEIRDGLLTYFAGIGTSAKTKQEETPRPLVLAVEEERGLPLWLTELVSDLGPTWEAKNGRMSKDRSERFHHLVGACRRADLGPAQTVEVLTPWCEAVGKFSDRIGAEVQRSWEKTQPEKLYPAATLRGIESTPDVGEGEEEWEEPLPLTNEADLSIDLTGLPVVLQQIIEAHAEQSQSPVEVVLAAVLGTIAAATRGVWDVHVRPGWNAGPTVLWLTTLAGSGERKGAGQDPIVRPLIEAEKSSRITVNQENRLRAGRRDLLEGELKAALKKTPEPSPEEVEQLTAKIYHERTRPTPRLVISDTTTEALGLHLSGQGGAAALFSTEATAFATIAGHYSEKGANVGLLNDAYDGSPYSDLRVKREAINVQRPAVSWCTAVQPEVLAGYATAGTEGSGFLARFILFAPESRVGTRSLRTTPVPEELTQQWSSMIQRLYRVAWEHYEYMTDDPDDLKEPLTLTCTPEAAEAIMSAGGAIEWATQPGSPLHSLGGWTQKHNSRIARVAAVLALVENPYGETIEVKHAQAALSLSDAFIRHALASFAIFRQSKRREPDLQVLEAIRKIGTPTVALRDIQRKVQNQAWVTNSGKRIAATVTEAMESLEDAGWLRQEPSTKGSGPGRPNSPTWKVHPYLVKGSVQQ